MFVINIPTSDKPNIVITSDFVEYQTHRYGVFVGNAGCCGALFDRLKAVKQSTMLSSARASVVSMKIIIKVQSCCFILHLVCGSKYGLSRGPFIGKCACANSLYQITVWSVGTKIMD